MQVLMDLIPTNFVRAFAEGNVAQVVVLAVLVGIATLLLGDEPRERFRAAFDDLARLLRKVADIILMAAPFGIGALMAVTIGRYGAPTRPRRAVYCRRHRGTSRDDRALHDPAQAVL
jgi:Na+/H+-dicarboxylate symporter